MRVTLWLWGRRLTISTFCLAGSSGRAARVLLAMGLSSTCPASLKSLRRTLQRFPQINHLSISTQLVESNVTNLSNPLKFCLGFDGMGGAVENIRSSASGLWFSPGKLFLHHLDHIHFKYRNPKLPLIIFSSSTSVSRNSTSISRSSTVHAHFQNSISMSWNAKFSTPMSRNSNLLTIISRKAKLSRFRCNTEILFF